MSVAPTAEPPFWKRKSLAEMSGEEWERLCDGCAKCCLTKLEDEVSGELFYTNVACRLLDLDICRCTRYAERHRLVANCEALNAGNVGRFDWLPPTCAYRRLAAGKDLPWWHPLVSGDPDTVHRVGASIRGRAVPEAAAGPPEHHIVTWPGEDEPE